MSEFSAVPCNKHRRGAFILVAMTTSGRESPEAERMAEWVREHGPAVRGYLLGIVRRADEADDLTQEVFCRAWQGRGRYQEQGHARTYLLRIADRLACDRMRRKKPADRLACDRMRRKKPAETLSEEGWRNAEPRSDSGDPVTKAIAAEAAERLNEALDQLTPSQQRVLLLRYYGQLTFDQIAETLGCPL
ncbi:MAG: RNA polymerase sigma factor, partial [Pirellulaceae bacterium]|nr:RNA polymerase sigma factor [Pirellulaceae bacterium]